MSRTCRHIPEAAHPKRSAPPAFRQRAVKRSRKPRGRRRTKSGHSTSQDHGNGPTAEGVANASRSRQIAVLCDRASVPSQ